MTRRNRSSAAQRRRTQVSADSNRRWYVVAGIGLVVVAAAVIAVALATSQPSISEPADASVIVTRTPLPDYPDSGTDPAIGMRLPTLQGVGLDGSSMTISADGRAKAIIVLAHWCPHCQAEVPRIVAWLADNPVPAGVDIVGISTAIDPTRPNYPPSAWLEREGWQQPTLVDDANSTGYGALGGTAFPGWVFVTVDGSVHLRTTGELDTAEFGTILEEIAP